MQAEALIKNPPYGTLVPEGLLDYDTDLHYGISVVNDNLKNFTYVLF